MWIVINSLSTLHAGCLLAKEYCVYKIIFVLSGYVEVPYGWRYRKALNCFGRRKSRGRIRELYTNRFFFSIRTTRYFARATVVRPHGVCLDHLPKAVRTVWCTVYHAVRAPATLDAEPSPSWQGVERHAQGVRQFTPHMYASTKKARKTAPSP